VCIELEDFAQLPRLKDTPADKGTATIRTDPNNQGNLFVSDQMGIIYRIQQKRPQVYLDIRDKIKNFIFQPGIGTGLGSFDFHPSFSKNGLLYTTHAENYTGIRALNDGFWQDSIGVGLQWVITEWKMVNPQADQFEGTHREILRINTPTTAHGMQDIAFEPGLPPNHKDFGLLFIGIGDGGSNNIKLPELCHSQRSFLGTIIRINPIGNNSTNGQYGIPQDNPFVQNADPAVKKEIYAFGFRNPHRMAWDEKNNHRMLIADIGEANVEEINVVQKG